MKRGRIAKSRDCTHCDMSITSTEEAEHDDDDP